MRECNIDINSLIFWISLTTDGVISTISILFSSSLHKFVFNFNEEIITAIPSIDHVENEGYSNKSVCGNIRYGSCNSGFITESRSTTKEIVISAGGGRFISGAANNKPVTGFNFIEEFLVEDGLILSVVWDDVEIFKVITRSLFEIKCSRSED